MSDESKRMVPRTSHDARQFRDVLTRDEMAREAARDADVKVAQACTEAKAALDALRFEQLPGISASLYRERGAAYANAAKSLRDAAAKLDTANGELEGEARRL